MKRDGWYRCGVCLVWGSRLGDLGFHLSQRKAEKAGGSLVAQRTDGWKTFGYGYPFVFWWVRPRQAG
jgi:hypothetical protein